MVGDFAQLRGRHIYQPNRIDLAAAKNSIHRIVPLATALYQETQLANLDQLNWMEVQRIGSLEFQVINRDIWLRQKGVK